MMTDSPLATPSPALQCELPESTAAPPSVVVMSLFKLLTLARTPVRAYCAPIATRGLRSVVPAAYRYKRRRWCGLAPPGLLRPSAAYCYTQPT